MKYLPIIAIILLALIGFAVNARAATILFPTGGGTGWSNLQANTLLTGNGTSRIATTSIGSGLTLSGGVLSATGGAGAFPFTPATSYGVNTSATTTALWGQASIFGSSTSATRPAFAASNSAGGPAGIFGQGSVGIGTTSPQNTLHVYSAGSQVARFAGPTDSIVLLEDISVADSSRPFGYLRSNDGKVALGNANRSGLSTTGSVDRLIIDSSGNVGFGSSTPAQALGVQGNGLFSGNLATAGLTATGTITFSGLSNGLVKSTSGVLSAATAGTDYLAPTSLSSTATGLTYTSGTGVFSLTSGYVIPLTASTTEWASAYANRITSATYPLQLSSNVLSLAFGTTTANTWSAANNFTSTLAVGSSTPWAQLSINPNGITGPAFAIGSSTGTSFVVTNGGKVGVGIASPNDALQVVGAVFSQRTSDAAGIGNFALGSAASTRQWTLRQTTTGNNFSLDYFNSSWGTALTVLNSNGYVGIGTTTPAQTLSVQGNALVSGNLSVANLTATGTIQAATLTLTNALGGQYGGTGSTTLSGILAGNGTSGVKTAVIGSGLAWDGTTLAVSGGSTASSTLLSDTNTWTGPNTYGSGLLRSTSPRITTSIFDANGATILGLTPVASATNYVTLTNSNGGTPGLSTNSGTVPLSLTGGGGVLTLTGDGTGTNGLTLNMAGGSAPVLSPTQSNTSLEINSNGSGSLLLNKSSGKVGVGTTSPAAILSVGAPAGTAPLMIGSTTKTLAQIDTNGKLQVLDTGTSYNGVVSSLRQLIFAPATTTTWTGTTSGPYIKKAIIPVAATIRQVICETDTGTLGVDLYHTSTHLAYLNASTTKGTFKFTSNNTMTAGETLYMVAGTPASSPTSVTCTVGITETP